MLFRRRREPRDRAGQCSSSGKTSTAEEFWAYIGWMMVGNGQGTPRNLGRAKFLITTQQVAIAGRPNS